MDKEFPSRVPRTGNKFLNGKGKCFQQNLGILAPGQFSVQCGSLRGQYKGGWWTDRGVYLVVEGGEEARHGLQGAHAGEHGPHVP